MVILLYQIQGLYMKRIYSGDFFKCMLMCLIVYVAGFNSAWAEIIQKKLPSGLLVTAGYQQGDAGKPAVLLLHGFLQTRHFSTVESMNGELGDAGYSTLTPTLSLGVSNRKQSLQCEAIHTHTMEEDVAEIDFWVNWLVEKGHQSVVLVGHSYGSLQSLVYMNTHRHASVKKLVAVSLVDVDKAVGKKANESQIAEAKRLLENNSSLLEKYQISFCQKYVAPPAAFLSYLKWTKELIFDALGSLGHDVEVIMGGNDHRMDSDWPRQLQQVGVNILIVDGANHFFDGMFEFDLNEQVLSAVASIKEDRK